MMTPTSNTATAKRLRVAVALSALLGCCPAHAEPDYSPKSIPKDVQGLYAEYGSCSDPTKQLTLTANGLRVGLDDQAPAVFYDNDSPNENGAVHWADEGDVSSFEVIDKKTLIYHPQGYGMDVDIPYVRCPDAKRPKGEADGPVVSFLQPVFQSFGPL